MQYLWFCMNKTELRSISFRCCICSAWTQSKCMKTDCTLLQYIYMFCMNTVKLYEDDVPHAAVSMFYMNTVQLYEDNVLNSSCCSICVVCEHTVQLSEDNVRFWWKIFVLHEQWNNMNTAYFCLFVSSLCVNRRFNYATAYIQSFCFVLVFLQQLILYEHTVHN